MKKKLPRHLQLIKDEIVFELRERGLLLSEIGLLFDMTKPAVSKAVKRYERLYEGE